MAVTVTDWIQTAAIIYFAWQQNRIFERQNRIFAGAAAMPKTSQTRWITRIARYWPTAVMVGLAALTGYDIYARHGAPPVIPWWFYVILLLIVAAIGSVIGRFAAQPEKPKEPSKLVIHSALYGVGDATDVDLTEKLNGITKEGLVVPVNNNLVDHDPSPNKFKRLKIRYQYDASEPHTVTLPEHSWLMLPENPQLLKLQSDIEVLQKRIEAATAPDTPPLTDNDPRIRLETVSVQIENSVLSEDHFILHNEGGSTAYRVRVEDIDLSNERGTAIASFQLEETILANKSKTSAPVIDSSTGSLLNLAQWVEWSNEQSTEAKSVIVTYYDYNGNEFKTGAELIHAPLAPETPSEMAKDFYDMAGQYHRKNPLEVILQRKERRAAGVSDIVVRNLRYWKVGRK